MNLQEIVNFILYESNYLQLYFIVVAYFLFLYFVVGPCFDLSCRFLHKRGLVEKIFKKPVPKNQISREIKYSIGSILIFGFSGFPIIYWIRSGFVTLAPDSILNIIMGLIILNVWNEIHFYTVHRIMHLPFFMRNVHKIHHQSVVPTVYSVYSFHWLEAFLLSTVPIIIVPFISFAPSAIAIYPLTSILFNYSGHCNYRFGSGKGRSWKLFGTNHNEHHSKFTNNYGFVSDLLDKLFTKPSKARK